MKLQDKEFYDIDDYNELIWMERARAKEENFKADRENLFETENYLSISEIIIPETQEIFKKEKMKLFDFDYNNKVKPKIIWHSTNSKVAAVDENTGEIAAKKCGKTLILARLPEYGKITKTCILTVVPKIKIRSVKQLAKNLKISVGESLRLNAYCVPSNASNCEVFWKSENENIVKSDLYTGYIKGVSPGITKIYAIAKENEKKQCCCTVTVEN